MCTGDRAPAWHGHSRVPKSSPRATRRKAGGARGCVSAGEGARPTAHLWTMPQDTAGSLRTWAKAASPRGRRLGWGKLPALPWPVLGVLEVLSSTRVGLNPASLIICATQAQFLNSYKA